MSDPIQFGRYRLVSLLGEGGMARVYKAVLAGQMGFEKTVALKRIPRSVTSDERMLKALINEARLGGRLVHKNIVETYEFDDIGGHYYLAMEMVDGWTLSAVLKACRENRHWMPISVVVEVFDNIMKGLVYAHELEDSDGTPQNLVHRDLKPGNIIVSRGGDVKVMDFGIAKAESNLYKTTDSNATKGTPVYMSPEQVRAKDLDQRSDIFSMGSVLHEMITLQVPFQGESLVAIVHGILETDLTRPLERVKARCPELVPLVAKMMSKEVEGRYANGREVRAALRELRADLPHSPTLADWLEQIDHELPGSTPDGEFGDDGPPQSVFDEASRSGEIMVPRTPASAGLDQTLEVKETKQQKQSSSSLPIVLGLVAAGLLGAGVVAFMQKSQQVATPAPTPVTEVATAAPTPVTEVAEVVTAAPEATSEATPEPTPEPPPEPTPARAVRATPPPAPRPEPTPAPAVNAEPGFLNLNSRPWSTVTIDGKAVGTVPIKNHEVAPGSHEVTFKCGPCDPAAEQTVVLTVASGQTERKIIRFE